jgi:hypothetical protein
MCSLSRSPAPVVGVRRLAKITQRFRNLLCGVCHGDIVPFLGPVPEGKFLVTDGQPGVGGRFGQDDDQSGSGAGRSLSLRCVSTAPSCRRHLQEDHRTPREAAEQPGASVSPTAYRPAAGHTGQGGRGQALLDRVVLRRAAGRDRARDREPQSHRPASRSPQRAHRRHQSRQIARSRCRGLPANRTGEVRVARRSSAHKRRGNKEA